LDALHDGGLKWIINGIARYAFRPHWRKLAAGAAKWEAVLPLDF